MFEYSVLERYKSQLAATLKREGVHGYIDISQWDNLYIILQPKPGKLRSTIVVKGHEDLDLEIKTASTLILMRRL